MSELIKILIVCSGNIDDDNIDNHHTFVFEQIESIKNKYPIEYDTLLIKGKGIIGYLKNIFKIKEKIKEFKPDLIHAHYGLSGLLSNMQRSVPVVTTFHGSEIMSFIVNLLSSFSVLLSEYNIFVTRVIKERMYFKPKNKFKIVPCGINLNESMVVDKKISLSKMNLTDGNVNIVFAGSFNDLMKNYSLAKEAIKLLPDKNINLVELKGYSRSEVNYLMNACDLFLLTSISEASPQTVKEAMACNCPIVATDVGEIKDIISDTEGCYFTSFEPKDIANKIQLAINFTKRTNGRDKIKRFDNDLITKEIFLIYQNIINKTGLNISTENKEKVSPLSLLFDSNNEVNFWDGKQNKIIESIVYDKNWNFRKKDSSNSRYGLFTLSMVLIAKDLFNLHTEPYDENIIRYVSHIKNNFLKYSKSDLTYGGLTSLILANKLYNLPDINLIHTSKTFDSTLENVIKDCDNQDSLILIAGKYLNDIYPDEERLQKLKFLTDRYLKSQNKTGYFETGDLKAIYHQRNMYILWGLIYASYFYSEKNEEINESVTKTLDWVWKNNRDKQDDAFHWHPPYYWIMNKKGINVPIINIKSSKYLFECHQTFFANAINFYQKRFNSFEFKLKKELAMDWIFGKNRIRKDLTTINGIGLPIRIMDLDGNIFIRGQKFKGSYEVGSYLLALAAENYYKMKF